MMTPCQKTLCENGEALFSVVLGLETFGFGGSMAKVNQYMIANGGYNADCSVNWAVMNGLNFAHFDSETTTAGYFQLCSWARRHHIVVAKYHDANHTARAGLVVQCDDLGNFLLRDGTGRRQMLSFLRKESFLVFFGL